MNIVAWIIFVELSILLVLDVIDIVRKNFKRKESK